jgi:hypothetical protein
MKRGFVGTTKQIIVDTDYDNYAVVYGCSRHWWTGWLLPYEHATILSRETFLKLEYAQPAKKAIDNTGYKFEFGSTWSPDTELRCDLNVEKEPDLEMNDILSFPPKWTRYNKVENTFKKMYEY